MSLKSNVSQVVIKMTVSDFFFFRDDIHFEKIHAIVYSWKRFSISLGQLRNPGAQGLKTGLFLVSNMTEIVNSNLSLEL